MKRVISNFFEDFGEKLMIALAIIGAALFAFGVFLFGILQALVVMFIVMFSRKEFWIGATLITLTILLLDKFY